MSRSTRVTSAPSVAATLAQVLPAGPPPRMSTVGMTTMLRADEPGTGQRNVARMPEMRHDPVSGRIVIRAAVRAARPHTLVRGVRDEDQGTEHCPFCPGHEAQTPPEITRTGAAGAGEPGWRVR